MTLNDLLDVAGSSVTVRCGDNYIKNVSTNNPLISKDIFQANVKCISSGRDYFDNEILEVEIEQTT